MRVRGRELEDTIRAWQATRPNPLADTLTDEHFDEQRNFDRDPARLKAALCGRRAGKTRGRNRGVLRKAWRTRGGRFLVINETSHEVRRLNWIGVQGDGMASTIERLKIPAHVDNTKMVVHFPEVDSWISCLGVDDEAAIGKALGGAYHEVWWDEAQKIPARFQQRIRETFMPTLLDFGGSLVLTGSPSRQMSGLFYEVTRPDVARRVQGWSVHAWNLLRNPHFGRVEAERGKFYVVGKTGRRVSRHDTLEEATAIAMALRYRDGLVDLQTLLGGADVAPMDGPIMQREGFGRWVAEDSAFAYAFHKCPPGALFYAPHRRRPDGFPDFEAALRDLPGWGQIEYFTAMGADLGYDPDPFAISAAAWSLHDPCIYELGTWSARQLDSEQQAAVLREVRDVVRPCVMVADAGGGGRPSVSGWSKEWVSKYGIPVQEAEKTNKNGAMADVSADMLTRHEGLPRLRLRDGSPLAEEYATIQWATVRTATGKLVEDPSIPNDCADAFLYLHRHSWHHRFRPAPPPADKVLQIEQELRDAAFDDELAPVLGIPGW